MPFTAKLFVDTWGWLALRDRGETRHGDVRRAYEACFARGVRIYTTDYVLDETFTLLFLRLPFPEAKASMELLSLGIREGAIISTPITSARFQDAQVLRLRYGDKPAISFTDLCSMVVMQEFAITEILTEDRHFLQVGLGFQRVP